MEDQKSLSFLTKSRFFRVLLRSVADDNPFTRFAEGCLPDWPRFPRTASTIHTVDMNTRSSITTFWLLSLAMVASPLLVGCRAGDDNLPRDQPRDTSTTAGAGARIDGDQPHTSQSSGSSKSNNMLKTITINGQPGLEFGNTRFELVTRNDLVNQYIPVGQTLENWQAMFVIRRFPELSTPQEAIDNVVENLIEQGADQKLISVTKGSRPDRELAIDFIIWTEDKSLTEFNVHFYRNVDGNMIAKMYLMRGYGRTGHDELSSTIISSRQLIVDSVLDSEFPVFIP